MNLLLYIFIKTCLSIINYEEKERSLKEKVRLQAEKKTLLEEKIKQLKAGGAERRGEVEGKRDLLVEKVKDDLEEISHLEQEEASLSKVEQQANTLHQEKTNLQARFKLLEEKNSSYLEEAAANQKKLEAAKERKEELEKKVGILEIENDKLVNEEKFLSQTLKNSGENLKMSKESEDAKENDLDKDLKDLREIGVRQEKLSLEEENMKDGVSARKAENLALKKENLQAEKEIEKLRKEKENLGKKVESVLAEKSAGSSQLIEGSKMMKALKEDLSDVKTKVSEKLQELEKFKEEEGNFDLGSPTLEKENNLLKSSEEKRQKLEESLEEVKKRTAAMTKAVRDHKIHDEIREAEENEASLNKELESLDGDNESLEKEEGTMTNQIEVGEQETKKETETVAKLQEELKRAQNQLEELSEAVQARHAATGEHSEKREKAKVAEQEILLLKEEIVRLRGREREGRETFNKQLEELTEQLQQQAKPWEEKRQEMERKVGNVEESLREVKKELRNKTALEGKILSKKEEERKALLEEKKNVDEKRKGIREQLARLQLKKASPTVAMESEEVIQRPASTKRKLQAAEKPKNLDPYAFDELTDRGDPSKPPKNTKKKAATATTPQKKKTSSNKYDELLTFSSPETSSP